MTEHTKRRECPDLIVSVESRKGGVGKTTAALCLGRTLRAQGYSVLVLDLDITGTNAADIAESPFWEGYLHVVHEKPANCSASSPFLTPVNLLSLFQHCFMTGMEVPQFYVNSGSAGKLTIDLERVNILGSQIYRMGEPHAGTQGSQSSGSTCIAKPGVLFDDLHSLWLLDFIKQIVADFCRIARSTTLGHEKVAVVLDNSPGYVGIAPVIHDWLTDLGPIIGKFLTVTSLDTQDLSACKMAVNLLHDLYRTKWQVSRLFLAAGTDGGELSMAKEQESFFMRLATSTSVADDVDSLDFFKCNYAVTANGNENVGEAFLDLPSKYIGVLVNRVPSAVKTGHLVCDLPDSVDEWLSPAATESPHSDGLTKWRDCMVSYDEYIENQFLLRSLRPGKRRSERRVHRLIDALEHAEHQLMTGEAGDSVPQIILLGESFSDCPRLRSRLAGAHEIVIRARSAVDDAGLGHLARLIHDAWLPGSIIPTFRSALSGLLRECDLPYLEEPPFEYRSGAESSSASAFAMHLKMSLEGEVRESDQPGHIFDEISVGVLAGIMASLVGVALSSPTRHLKLEDEIVSLFGSVFTIELNHFKKRQDGKLHKHSLVRFLASESVSSLEIREELLMFRKVRSFLHHMMMRDDWKAFADFYTACAVAQSRLIDFVADSLFIVKLLQFMVREELENKVLFPFVRGLAEDVIVNKSVGHKEAPSRMAKALQSKEYYSEFDRVLTRILRNWSTANV